MIIDEKDCLKEVESFDKTGFNYTLSLISGKYKLTVLYAIYSMALFVSTVCKGI